MASLLVLVAIQHTTPKMHLRLVAETKEITQLRIKKNGPAATLTNIYCISDPPPVSVGVLTAHSVFSPTKRLLNKQGSGRLKGLA